MAAEKARLDKMCDVDNRRVHGCVVGGVLWEVCCGRTTGGYVDVDIRRVHGSVVGGQQTGGGMGVCGERCCGGLQAKGTRGVMCMVSDKLKLLC